MSTSMILALMGCLLAEAFFVAAEVAVTACDRGRIRAAAKDGGHRAKLIEKLIERPDVALSTTLIGANVAALSACLLIAIAVIQQGGSPLWAVLLVVPPMLVVGQVVPRTLSQANADRMVRLLGPTLAAISWLLRPGVVVVRGFAAVVSRLLGTERKRAFVTRDELAMLIESDPQSDRPEISAEEREMISNVFELSEYTVRELMVPLSEVTALPEDTSMAEAVKEVIDKQHSRMPIYRSRVDDIVGIVHVFDVLQAFADGKIDAVREIGALAHPVAFVPETMRASELLVQLQAEDQHLAIVVDEYGGAVGMVTVEDLLEIIVGDIDDEHDDEPSKIWVEKPGVWRVEARTSVARVNHEIDSQLPESDDYETVAGLLIEKLRRIPDVGTSITIGNLLIEVVEATQRAIEAVRITKKKK